MNCSNCGKETEGGYCDCMIVNGEFKGARWNQEAIHGTEILRGEVLSLKDYKKATLPTHVAEALEKSRNQFTDGEIFSAAAGWNNYSDENLKLIQDWILSKSPGQREELENKIMLALVNGYTVEKTPEEQIRDFYVETVRIANQADSKSNDRVYYNGIIRGLEHTIAIIGMKIKGVNAK